MSVETDIRELIAIERETAPFLLDLARPLSLASRIEPELVRAMRRAVLPASNPGLESDLWLSPLVQARDPRAIALLPDVVDVFRAELATAPFRPILEQAWSVVSTVHRGIAPVIALEEEATYYALVGSGDAIDKVEALLGRALATLEASGDVALARWVIRTLPRMPEVVRTSEAALALAAKSAELTGGVPVSGVIAPGTTMPAWSRRSLAALPKLDVGIRFRSDGLEIRQPPGEGDAVVKVPSTTPLVVDVETPTVEGWRLRREKFTPGTPVIVDVEIGPAVRVTTIDGEESLLRADGTPTLVVAAEADVRDLLSTITELGWTLDQSSRVEEAERHGRAARLIPFDNRERHEGVTASAQAPELPEVHVYPARDPGLTVQQQLRQQLIQLDREHGEQLLRQALAAAARRAQPPSVVPEGYLFGREDVLHELDRLAGLVDTPTAE